MEESKTTLREGEIDLLLYANFIWNDRKSILIIVSISTLLGLVFAFSLKDEYTSSTDLLVESSTIGAGSLSSLGGLASLAGVGLGNVETNLLSPDLYPKIANSTPFVKAIIDQPLFFEKLDTIITAKDYFLYFNKPTVVSLFIDYTIGLPSKIKKMFSSQSKEILIEDDSILWLNREDWILVKDFKERLEIMIEPGSSIMKISTKMPDRVAAALINKLVVDRLTSQISKYKIEKSNSNLEFVKERLHESKIAYTNKQEEYAKFSNENKYISNALVSARSQRIQNELNVLFEVYKGLASQNEQLEIKVKEETPIFTVIEPAMIPLDKSSMRKMTALFISMIVGFALAFGISIFKKVIKDLKQ